MTKKVIIVEDDPHLGPLMKELCSSNGLESILLTDGEKAISYFSSTKVPEGIAFIDYQMPNLCGDKVLDFLARNSFCGLRRVFLFTSMCRSYEPISQICSKMEKHQNIFAYLQKSPGTFFEKVEPILRRYKEQ